MNHASLKSQFLSESFDRKISIEVHAVNQRALTFHYRGALQLGPFGFAGAFYEGHIHRTVSTLWQDVYFMVRAGGEHLLDWGCVPGDDREVVALREEYRRQATQAVWYTDVSIGPYIDRAIVPASGRVLPNGWRVLDGGRV